MAAVTLKYKFPAGNTLDVCLLQNVLAGNNLVLSGNLASVGNNTVSFISNGYSRQVSITSANNLSAANFTIIGSQNGFFLQETLSGPNNNTVYSTNIYDFIISISVDIAVTGVSAGTGYKGYFKLIPIDLSRNPISYALSLGATLNSNQIPTAIYSTLDNIASNGSTFATAITTNGLLTTVKASSAENLYVLPVSPVTTVSIVNSLLVVLNGTTSTIGNSTTLNFIQC